MVESFKILWMLTKIARVENVQTCEIIKAVS